MFNLRTASLGVLVLCLLTLLDWNAVRAEGGGGSGGSGGGGSAGDAACADSTAKNIITTVGGRSRIMTVLMNFVKCLQRASNDIYKLVNDLLIELANCLTKNDPIEVAKCMMSDSGTKKITAIIMKSMDVVKCSLE